MPVRPQFHLWRAGNEVDSPRVEPRCYEQRVKEPMRFVDVFGTDPDMQALVPGPILSLLLLYPLTENVKKNAIGTISMDEKCFFMKQTVSNACGTVAILHALANNVSALDLDSLPWLRKFLEKAHNSTPKERAEILENEEELSELHESCAHQGQTEVSNSQINLHFVAFVNSGGHLIELDGRCEGPILHGTTSPNTFLADACKVVDKFMQRDPDNVNFSLMALTNAEGFRLCCSVDVVLVPISVMVVGGSEFSFKEIGRTQTFIVNGLDRAEHYPRYERKCRFY
ncbi:Ubiquitin carboxyl-terminal hydrolase isozyme L3 [Taenia crassiceps]|uniref:Ubiquitin carboxyl-terminal hydrolase n=1 Tax=Taenia crassiceps TaxID=6207 RepID=A0ABR4QJN8_9CEST